MYFKTSLPSMGDCTNDTFTITGADSISMKNMPTNLCGILTGQHLYVSVKTVSSVKITMNFTSTGSQKYNILIRQYDSS